MRKVISVKMVCCQSSYLLLFVVGVLMLAQLLVLVCWLLMIEALEVEGVEVEVMLGVLPSVSVSLVLRPLGVSLRS